MIMSHHACTGKILLDESLPRRKELGKILLKPLLKERAEEYWFPLWQEESCMVQWGIALGLSKHGSPFSPLRPQDPLSRLPILVHLVLIIQCTKVLGNIILLINKTLKILNSSSFPYIIELAKLHSNNGKEERPQKKQLLHSSCPALLASYYFFCGNCTAAICNLTGPMQPVWRDAGNNIL